MDDVWLPRVSAVNPRFLARAPIRPGWWGAVHSLRRTVTLSGLQLLYLHCVPGGVGPQEEPALEVPKGRVVDWDGKSPRPIALPTPRAA